MATFPVAYLNRRLVDGRMIVRVDPPTQPIPVFHRIAGRGVIGSATLSIVDDEILAHVDLYEHDRYDPEDMPTSGNTSIGMSPVDVSVVGTDRDLSGAIAYLVVGQPNAFFTDELTPRVTDDPLERPGPDDRNGLLYVHAIPTPAPKGTAVRDSRGLFVADGHGRWVEQPLCADCPKAVADAVDDAAGTPRRFDYYRPEWRIPCTGPIERPQAVDGSHAEVAGCRGYENVMPMMRLEEYRAALEGGA